ncbi:MAG: cupin domain-containing protein, partial [Deltaproteobacteria bacterium]|nr:cupin domain-containing protein [Deltaproteobacteria bacterium]
KFFRSDAGNRRAPAVSAQRLAHCHGFDALVCMLEGKADISISGKPVTAKAGDMIIMPANQPHALSATERFKMLLIMIRS